MQTDNMCKRYSALKVYKITFTSVDKNKKLCTNRGSYVAETADLALRKCLDEYSYEVLDSLTLIQIKVGEEVIV